jgi:acetyl/propionyl-CoA carboxylase alpha subunit
MGECACMIAEAAKYKGAGTVEFLLQDGSFYLMEVNTRLQVEHPVTEEVVGVDLVKAQILTAMNEPAFPGGASFSIHGHSIECRLYAENPFQGGVPSTGLLGKVEFPEGPGRRFEYGFEAGDEITSYYDPMIAKVIVWDETRSRAIQKMIQVLKQTKIFGVHTNIPYLIEILSHPEFVSGTMTTRFIETHFSEPLKSPVLSEQEKWVLQLARRKVGGEVAASPWTQFWRGV